jgi:hypothetical protein
MNERITVLLVLICVVVGCSQPKERSRSSKTEKSEHGMKDVTDTLVADLSSALGNQWDIRVNANILTLVSKSNLAWVFLPPSSSIDAFDDVYHRQFRVEYRIKPFLSQTEYSTLYLAMRRKGHKLQQKVARLEKEGMPRGPKGSFRPRNKQEKDAVSEYLNAMCDSMTLPVYHYKSSSLFNLTQRSVMDDYHVPADDSSEHQMNALWKKMETVLSKYKEPQKSAG